MAIIPDPKIDSLMGFQSIFWDVMGYFNWVIVVYAGIFRNIEHVMGYEMDMIYSVFLGLFLAQNRYHKRLLVWLKPKLDTKERRLQWMLHVVRRKVASSCMA